MMKEALKIRQQRLGEDDYLVAMTLNELAITYGRTGEKEKLRIAIIYLNQAREILKNMWLLAT